MRNASFILLATAILSFCVADVTFAQPGGKRGGDKGTGVGGKGPGGKGVDGKGPGGGMMDPMKLAQRMIENHDKNGDGALNAKELAAAFTAMRKMRQGGGPGGKGGDGKGFGGKGGDGKFGGGKGGDGKFGDGKFGGGKSGDGKFGGGKFGGGEGGAKRPKRPE